MEARGSWTCMDRTAVGWYPPVRLRRIEVSVWRVAAGALIPQVVCADGVSGLVVRPDRANEFLAVAYAPERFRDHLDGFDYTASDKPSPSVTAGRAPKPTDQQRRKHRSLGRTSEDGVGSCGNVGRRKRTWLTRTEERGSATGGAPVSAKIAGVVAVVRSLWPSRRVGCPCRWNHYGASSRMTRDESHRSLNR